MKISPLSTTLLLETFSGAASELGSAHRISGQTHASQPSAVQSRIPPHGRRMVCGNHLQLDPNASNRDVDTRRNTIDCAIKQGIPLTISGMPQLVRAASVIRSVPPAQRDPSAQHAWNKPKRGQGRGRTGQATRTRETSRKEESLLTATPDLNEIKRKGRAGRNRLKPQRICTAESTNTY